MDKKKFFKGLTQIKGGKMTVIASTETMDRTGDSLKALDWDLNYFMKNPVLQAGHDYRPQYTIGVAKNIRVENKQLVFEPQFHNITPLATQIAKMYEQGFLTAWSVGFIPKEQNVQGKKNQLLEVSAVAVPANPEALTSIKSFENQAKDYDDSTLSEVENWIQKEVDVKSLETDEEVSDTSEVIAEIKAWDESDAEITYVLRSLSDFDESTIEDEVNTDYEKPITITAGELADGSGEAIQKCVFLKSDDWTLQDAQAWVKDNADYLTNWKSIAEEAVKAEMIHVETLPGGNPEHTHAAMIDSGNGDGATSRVNDHIHEIIGYKVQDTNGHTHELPAGTNPNEAPANTPDAPPESMPTVGAQYGKVFANGRYKTRQCVNKNFSKEFDIEKLDSQPANWEYKVYTDYLDVKVKDIFLNVFEIPMAMLGNYLAAFKSVLSEYDLKDTRSFGWEGGEKPPVYQVVQLNSTKSDDFLIDGVRFYQAKDKRFIIKIEPGWSGLYVVIVSSITEKAFNKDILTKANKWIDENNLLKGEAFSLNGEFISKTSETMNDVILEDSTKDAVTKTIAQMVKKGKEFPSRGMLFMGEPGTGKTKTGRAILNETQSTFLWVSSKDFSRFGATYGLALAFNLVRELAPSVLFIEDIDAWLRDYNIDLLKTEMDGIQQNKGVLTILTSNFPENLPKALIDRPGRFHDVLEFKLPSPEIRQQMLESWITEEQKTALGAEKMSKIIEMTDGFSGAHMKELVEFAKTISEEDSVPLDIALITSLEKMVKQRELIVELQNKTKALEQIVITVKEGRVLSTKNVNLINEAITAQKNSVGALEKLLVDATVESKDTTDKSQTPQVSPNKDEVQKGRAEISRHNGQKIKGHTSEQIALRTLQLIAGAASYGLNKAKKK